MSESSKSVRTSAPVDAAIAEAGDDHEHFCAGSGAGALSEDTARFRQSHTKQIPPLTGTASFISFIFHLAVFKDPEGTERELPACTFRMRSALLERVNWSNLSLKGLGKLLELRPDEASVGMQASLRQRWQTWLNAE